MLRRLTESERRTVAHWAMEFVVVVVGVLLALWLQGRVERANQAAKMHAAETAIRAELDDNLLILVAHKAVDQCLSDRLGEVEQRLAGGGRATPLGGHPLMLPRVKRPASSAGVVYTFFDVRVQDSAWTSALSSGALAEMDRARFAKLAELYGMFQMIDRALVAGVEAGETLQVLGYGTDLTPDLRARLIGAMNTATRGRQFLSNATTPDYIAGEMRKLGWDDRKAMDTRIRDFTNSMHGFGFHLKPCAKPFANPFVSG